MLERPMHSNAPRETQAGDGGGGGGGVGRDV